MARRGKRSRLASMSRPGLVAEHQKRPLGGIADDLAVLQLRVIRDDVREDGVVDGEGRAGGVLYLPVEAVADARDGVAVDGVEHLDDGHLVHRQRAGLVRVDGRRGSKRLHGDEVLDDRLLRGQLLGAGGEDHLEDGRQRRRDGRDRQGDGRDEEALGVLAAREPQREHDDHRPQSRCADPQGHGVQLPGERRLLLGGRRQHAGDLADLGVGAYAGDDHHAAAVGDRRVHERHIGAVAGAELGVGECVGRLGGGHALAGERRLVDVQRARLDDPPVGGHVVARGEQHDVAGHDLLRRDLRLDAVAAHARRQLHQRLERVHRALCLALLAQAGHGVEHREGDEDQAGAPLADDQRDRRGDQQDDLHVRAVLVEEPPPARLTLLFGKSVGPVLLQQLGGLRHGEAARRVHTEPAGDVLGRERVPALGRPCRPRGCLVSGCHRCSPSRSRRARRLTSISWPSCPTSSWPSSRACPRPWPPSRAPRPRTDRAPRRREPRPPAAPWSP